MMIAIETLIQHALVGVRRAMPAQTVRWKTFKATAASRNKWTVPSPVMDPIPKMREAVVPTRIVTAMETVSELHREDACGTCDDNPDNNCCGVPGAAECDAGEECVDVEDDGCDPNDGGIDCPRSMRRGSGVQRWRNPRRKQ